MLVSALTSQPLASNTWHYAALKWWLDTDGSTVHFKMFLNDQQYTDSIVAWDFAADSLLALGSKVNGTYQLNGYISRFAYSPYALDDADILAGYQAGRGTHINYRYDTIGRPTATTVSTGIYDYVTAYDYVPGVGGATTMRIASITNDGDAIGYTYDANWNIETITEGGLVNRYYYDEMNQLIREDNGVLEKTIVYTYDLGGNILAKNQYAYTAGGEPDPNTLERIEYSYDDPVWRDLLTGYNGSTITYDDIGNPMTARTATPGPRGGVWPL